MIEYTNGKPVLIGDIVHVRNRPYTITRIVGDYAMLQSMCERREFKPVYPQDIGARVRNDHIEPTIREVLRCFYG